LRRADVDVTVIDRTNHHLIQPLLCQVATGILSEGDIAPPIREILRHQRNTRVVLGEVVDIDLGARRVTVETVGQRNQLAFDSLIVAAGASQSYFGHSEFARDAPGMKTIDHALELRGRILSAFEMAERETLRLDRPLHCRLAGRRHGPNLDGPLRGRWARDHRGDQPPDFSADVQLSMTVIGEEPMSVLSGTAIGMRNR